MAKKTEKTAASSAIKRTAAPKSATKTTAVKKATTPKVAATKAVVKKSARKAPAASTARPSLKSGAPTPTITTITAKADVGFGNSLYVRGGGAGLSWTKGVLMGNAAADEWVWSTDAVTGTLEFKVLINDEIWARGENGTVSAGDRVVVHPTF